MMAAPTVLSASSRQVFEPLQICKGCPALPKPLEDRTGHALEVASVVDFLADNFDNKSECSCVSKHETVNWHIPETFRVSDRQQGFIC